MPPHPSELRPGRRPPIFRVKTGCLTCRSRKKKCDEVKPTCTGCRRNRLPCYWPTCTERRGGVTRKARPQEDVTVEPSTDVQQPSPPEQSSPGQRRQSSDSLSPPSSSSSSSGADVLGDTDHQSHLSRDWSDSSLDGRIAIDTADAGVNPDIAAVSLYPAFQSASLLLPAMPSLLPGQDGESFALLSHYLSRTAYSMGNGSTEANPFINHLIPMCFANELILELVLCQSAVHRAVESIQYKDVARKHYSKSLSLFRRSIDAYVEGRETSPLWIAVGALIMCFTETAQGDTHGVVFDHLNAAGPLLTSLVSSPPDFVTKDGSLKNFIVEYYVYTASISLISIDPRPTTIIFLTPDLTSQAHKLVESSYIGQLCGCWLELLLLIPRIFDFGRRSLASESSATNPPFPTADDFATFSALQMQILGFNTYLLGLAPGSDVALCGQIFQQAVHLYLLTCLPSSRDSDGPQKTAVNAAIGHAFEFLRQLSPLSRINTSLCWALAVVGSCISDAKLQTELRQRLSTMFGVIGLGNIQATAAVLERVWELPAEQRSPWVICKVMQEHEIWISFA